MKNIEVCAAIIKDDGKILSTQRKGGEFDGLWEFPGGKIEPEETHEKTLIREIQEELEVLIKVNEFVTTVQHQYDTFHLTMHCYFCEIVTGQINLLEHSDAKWLSKDELDTVEWLEADIEIIEKLKTMTL